MTTPEGTATSPPPANPRLLNLVQGKPLTARRAARIIASVTLSITVISGVLMHFTDEKTYPTIGDGLWWAIQTVTTVGYGDLVPTSTVGRLVAALVMVVGIGFLTVVTASITSAFIESARRRLQGTEADTLSPKLDQIGARLEEIEAGLKALGGHHEPGDAFAARTGLRRSGVYADSGTGLGPLPATRRSSTTSSRAAPGRPRCG